MIAALVEQLSLTDVLIVVAIVGAGITKYLEGTGRTPSSKLLRAENHDLVERSRTLERSKDEAAAQHALELAESKANELRLLARIEALELKVRELESRDQGAVLHALAEHEIRAQGRADHAEERASERHGEAMGTWNRIATAIEGGTP